MTVPRLTVSKSEVTAKLWAAHSQGHYPVFVRETSHPQALDCSPEIASRVVDRGNWWMSDALPTGISGLAGFQQVDPEHYEIAGFEGPAQPHFEGALVCSAPTWQGRSWLYDTVFSTAYALRERYHVPVLINCEDWDLMALSLALCHVDGLIVPATCVALLQQTYPLPQGYTECWTDVISLSPSRKKS